MHHIYHTEGIILGSKGYGEAGKYYSIFTRDLGMIHASASGVRKMQSKLRYVLQDFAYIKVDLVRGKEFWRVTSASKTNLLEDISKNTETLKVFHNISRLLKRLLQGEEPNVALFEDLIKGLFILEKCSTKDEISNTEAVLVLRALSHLGYIGGDNLESLIKSPLEEELIWKALEKKPEILKQINQALKETHL
jgi:DNA repair protein RecO